MFKVEASAQNLQGRLISIDALRGIAALAVTLCHALRFQPFVGRPGIVGESLAFIFYWGLIGVYLFFIISGFCIHLSWAKQAVNHQIPKVDFISFWKRRIRRLYPAYLISMAAYLVVMKMTGTLELTPFFGLDLFLHLLMLHNILAVTTYSMNGVFWSLAVEEELYLAYFLFLKMRARMGWLKILGITLLARVAWFALGFILHRKWNLEITVFEAAASLWFCWVLGALSVEAAVGLVKLPNWCTSWAFGLGTLAVTLTIATIDRDGPTSGLFHNLRTLIIQPLWGVSFFVIVNCVVTLEPKLKGQRGFLFWLSRLGAFSYSLYLTHELILTHLVNEFAKIFDWSAPTKTLFSILLFTPISILFAWVFFRFFERPFMNKPVPVVIQTPEKAVANV